MSDAPEDKKIVSVNRVFLNLENPCHVPVDTEAQAIIKLCEKEDVFPLARDIVKHGLNRMENFGLIPVAKGQSEDSKQGYFVAEGNRCICALKLLNDPDLAPANMRKSYEKLAENWTPVKVVSAVIFNDLEEVRLWLDRIHSGPQGGVGRKDWKPEQKTRFDGESRNRPSQAFLDYAEAKGMISVADRVGKLTTVQRFLSNDVFREALGLDQSDVNEVGRTRPEGEFNIILAQFIRDLVEKQNVNSRMNKEAIIKYARPLSALNGVSTARVQSEPLSAVPDVKPKGGKPRAPRPPAKVAHVLHQAEIEAALKAFGNEKLISLYHSICTVDLDPHTPMVAIGTWSFFETLTACAGRSTSASIDSYLSKDKLKKYGFTGEAVTYQATMIRIREYGNTTKHHPISATFNGDQLNNDVTTLKYGS